MSSHKSQTPMPAGRTGQMAQEPEITGQDVRASVSSWAPSRLEGNLLAACRCFPVLPPRVGVAFSRCFTCSSVFCVDAQWLDLTSFKWTSFSPLFHYQTRPFALTLSRLERIVITFWKGWEIIFTLVLFFKREHILYQVDSSFLMIQSTSTQYPLALKPWRMHLGSKNLNWTFFKRFVCVGKMPFRCHWTKPKVNRNENPSGDFRCCSRLGAAARFLPIFKNPFCIKGGYYGQREQ